MQTETLSACWSPTMSSSDIRNFHGTREPYPIPNSTSRSEWERLDELHNGITVFLGNRLTFADIDFNPKRILEVGCGSGTWAIQAANTYPDAEVLAIDISSLPPRPLPKNMSFRKMNVMEDVPFDIVHLRFVCIHVRNFRDVLARLTALLRPGGWLLVDEAESEVKGNIGPNITKFYEIYHSFTGPDVEPLAGALIKSVLMESGSFSEVNVRKVNTPFSGIHEDPAVANLGEIMGAAFFRIYKVLDPRLVEFGLTKEIQDGWFTEVNDPERNLSFNMWSRKSQ
ncbi:hypothetical protein M422DRAFT_253139 [Sphaerobolus stellatus SS14]|uniref:Methyltransferase domain-containing protein n=1 Tax=Sphaerobolus stellatus (strain SS14) TaxID=990650 RepID=A0A0C9V9A0_SPHS4|nr:hypothetical protein M422DRAFT_253139 [Sphaerobolus stellatus SS14]